MKTSKSFSCMSGMAMMLVAAGNGGNGGTTNDGQQTDGEKQWNSYGSDFDHGHAETEPQSFNPDFKSDDGAWPINQNIFNRLVKLGA